MYLRASAFKFITGNVGIGTASPTGGKVNIVGGNLNMSGNDIISVDKLTVTTIDPIYNVDGEKYATYAPFMVGGVKEEVVGAIILNVINETGEYVINFNNLEKGSNLWLFYQITDFGKDMGNLQVFLTPGFNGNVWYEKVPEENSLIIYGSNRENAEVSYRFTANRHDYTEWLTSYNGSEEGRLLSIK